MDEILKFLEENNTFYFATIEDGKPKVRPFGFFMGFDDKLYFAVNDSKPAYDQLKLNPYFEVSVASPQNEWIILSGKAIFDCRDEVKAYAHSIDPHIDNLDKPGCPNLIPFYVEDCTCTFYSLTSDPHTLTF
jgi:uncharacterized pyridoxamine 5'-phosphate oxidase family protein